MNYILAPSSIATAMGSAISRGWRRSSTMQDLGVTVIWLLPFYPSPLKDDGYDISDYTDVHPSYGTLNDFREFLREAHARGLRVITELIVNHTSDQHPWFQRCPSCQNRQSLAQFLCGSDTPGEIQGRAHYFQAISNPRTGAGTPSPKPITGTASTPINPTSTTITPKSGAILHVVDFWLNMGIDGLRLDAVPYLYEREGTNCENLAETHAFLKELRRHVDRKFKNRMLLAEANQWPEDAVAYWATGMSATAFHFPVCRGCLWPSAWKVASPSSTF